MFFGILNLCNITQTIFFYWVLVEILKHKKNLDQKNHSSLEINSSKVGGSNKKWCKTLPKYTTSIGFPLKSEKMMNFTNFLIFNGNPMEVEHFGRVLLHFLLLPPTLSELISKLKWFFWSRFFCASMSRPIVNRKNCLGDVAAVYNPENVNNFFPLQIFPEGSIHLPGERDLQGEKRIPVQLESVILVSHAL